MTSPRVIYIGIKTEKLAHEVGGWSKVDKMGLREVLIYDTATRRSTIYSKSEVSDMIATLQTADLVVGFNQLNFDYKILSTYTEKDLATLPNFDMLDKIEQTLNFRVSRDNLAANTLDSFKMKSIRNVTDRVEITKKLFAHACREGYLLYENKLIGGKDRCDTSSWAETARNLSQRNKFLAETKVISEKNISENPDNSIPNAPTPPLNPWKDKVEANIDSSFPKDQKHTDITPNPNNSTIGQVNIEKEARQIYDQTKNRNARAWYAYNKFARLHGPVMPFHQFMTTIGRVSKSSQPKKKLEKRFRYHYIDGSGTLASEWVNDHIDVRNIMEELARGI